MLKKYCNDFKKNNILILENGSTVKCYYNLIKKNICSCNNEINNISIILNSNCFECTSCNDYKYSLKLKKNYKKILKKVYLINKNNKIEKIFINPYFNFLNNESNNKFIFNLIKIFKKEIIIYLKNEELKIENKNILEIINVDKLIKFKNKNNKIFNLIIKNEDEQKIKIFNNFYKKINLIIDYNYLEYYKIKDDYKNKVFINKSFKNKMIIRKILEC